MKKQFAFVALLLLGLLTTSSRCQKSDVDDLNKDQSSEVQIILDRTAYFCAERCRTQYLFEDGQVLTSHFDRPNDEDPRWECRRNLPAKQWQSILDALDMNALSSTDPTIGCPGCADEPIETLVVSNGEKNFEIRMNQGAEVPSIQALLDVLRPLADQYSTENNCL